MIHEQVRDTNLEVEGGGQVISGALENTCGDDAREGPAASTSSVRGVLASLASHGTGQAALETGREGSDGGRDLISGRRSGASVDVSVYGVVTAGLRMGVVAADCGWGRDKLTPET